MDADRFDAISRLFASRSTRRRALAGTAGMAAALSVAPTLGQDASPVAEVDLSDPHPSADTATHDPEFLFVQPFSSGTWSPKPGEEGTYTLSLTGASANTVYFSDRPERIFGLSSTGTFIDTLGFSPDNPPNAAIVAQHPDGADQEVLVVELLNPAYDGDTLTYDARVLADYGEPGLAHAARQQQDYTLSESFAAGSLFIDDCPDEHYYCIGNESGTIYGRVNVGQCWDSTDGCQTCHDPSDYCMSGLPNDCRKETVIDGVTTYANVCHAQFDL